MSNSLLHRPRCFDVCRGWLLDGGVRYPLLYRGWLERILQFPFFLFAITAHFDEKDDSNSNDNEDNDWNEDHFEQKLYKTHDEKDWSLGIGGRDWYHTKGDCNENIV